MTKKQIVGSVMVVGGGVAGIQASLDLADSGFKVYLIEKSSSIGGVMAQLDKTFPTNDCSMCVISPKLVEAGRHLNIDLITLAEVKKIVGKVGDFIVTLNRQPRFIDLEKCTACAECTKVCPVDIPNNFDQGLSKRKAIFKLYPQAMPSPYVVEKRGIAPCKATCPVNPSIQGCFALMNQGKYKEAFHLFITEHPMPGICGRVCHHPCETSCLRSQIDQPISIMALHRFLADWAKQNNVSFVPNIGNRRSEKIAIIGSGPAGLSCAYFLAIEGFQVTIFEKNELLGGMLTLGIPPYRLPRNIIDGEINILRKMGVKIRTGINIGIDLNIDDLKRKDFKAFFIAIGAHKSKTMNIAGEEAEGVFSGIDFLLNINIGKNINLGNKVAVIGGGNVAIDSVRTALRTGSKEPFIIYRRSKTEMPANQEEIEECLEEGIEIKTLTQPIRIIKTNRRVSAIECLKMKLGKKDINGRQLPEPILGSEFIIEVDSIISAIGQKSDWQELANNCTFNLTAWDTIEVNPTTFQSKAPDIFAGGDVVNGPATVIAAISDGKKASKAIKNYVCNEPNYIETNQPLVSIKDIDISTLSISKKTRETMPLADLEKRKNSIIEEVQLGYDENQVINELKRCLSCGICSECYQCVDVCLSKAIDHNMIEKQQEINVGAIILASGFTPFNPTNYETYNYANHPNILTSLEFERILSASGPNQGLLLRPSDNKPPKKIAWLQCVGSRDINKCDNEYCSSVCCMYANKQALVSKEHSKDKLDTVIFFMDMRTFGKDFDKYVDRAKKEKGIRHIRSRVHSVLPTKNDSLKIIYSTEKGGLLEDIFDIVVLSIGLSSNIENVQLAKIADIELNQYKYAKTSNFNPTATSKEGIYVCGSFQEPKDIPLTVTEASASAALATELLYNVRWSLTENKDLPPELDVSEEKPRIGVFVCNCGINIGGVANVPEIRDYATSLPHVVHVEDNLFTCSQDSQEHIKEILQGKSINRVVIASCSPRTHESLFQETIRDAGLNKYLFEMANIRDQNTWVHMHDTAKATQKAKDLIRMAVAKAAQLEALHQVNLKIIKKALVVGGGIAGMEAALGLANQECNVLLIEKTKILGGNALLLDSTWKGELISNYLNKIIKKVLLHPRITVHNNTEIKRTSGSVGNFETFFRHNNSERKEESFKHGTTIIAVGGQEFKPNNYFYGINPTVLTHLDFDIANSNNNLIITKAKNIAFIQCVGSRDEIRPYCSKVCCSHSLKNAVKLKKIDPTRKIVIIYRDIRSYGFREKLYKEAREVGILFIRYDLENQPKVIQDGDKKIVLNITDHVLSTSIKFKLDLLVLATGIIPNINKQLYNTFKLPINNDGFLVEAHAKLRPVDFSSEGIFMAGLAHSPKPIEESIAQAKAVVSRAMTIMSKDTITVGGIVASVNSTKCAVCLTCVRTCPYHVPRVQEHSYATIEAVQCHGCGTCVAECPSKAISLAHFTDNQLISKAQALFLT